MGRPYGVVTEATRRWRIHGTAVEIRFSKDALFPEIFTPESGAQENVTAQVGLTCTIFAMDLLSLTKNEALKISRTQTKKKF
jgi:hypothetical protein